jgi:hypothetical protein
MKNNSIGFGSFFHKTDLSVLPDLTNSFLEAHQLFYAGRYAMKYVFETLADQYDITHIWLPYYYCPFVKAWLDKGFNNLKYYDIDPFDADSQVNWDQFSPNDLVLVNNYWGVKQNSIPSGNRPLIVEDHSHGWLSPGCMDSEADLCIASLRKTLPVPLGGIAWKPKKSKLDLRLPLLRDTEDTHEMYQAWDMVMEAMEKKAYCNREEDKTEFLECYGKGENLLRKTQEIIPLHTAHAKLLHKALFKDYNVFKMANVSHITAQIAPNDRFKILGNGLGTPFGLLLVFRDHNHLMGLKQHLISKSIYPAELWPQNNILYEYKFLLNIHMDYRYDEDDLEYMAAAINQWSKKESEHDV